MYGEDFEVRFSQRVDGTKYELVVFPDGSIRINEDDLGWGEYSVKEIVEAMKSAE